MSTKMSTTNNSDFQTKVMAELAAIREILAGNTVSSAPKEKKTRKPRDPSAAPNPWIVFTGKVRTILKNANKPAGKECQQFASYLKNTFPDDAYNMDDSEILAAHESWTPPPPKPKDETPATTTETDAKPKPKRTLSDEQKAKMAAGRKAAAERKRAEKEAASTVVDEAEEVEDTPPAPVVTKPSPTLKALPFKSKKYLWDPENNGMWLKNDDGSKGAWAGVLSKDKKSIDASATDYTV